MISALKGCSIKKIESHCCRRYSFSKKTQVIRQILDLNSTSVCTNDKALYYRGSLAVDNTLG